MCQSLTLPRSFARWVDSLAWLGAHMIGPSLCIPGEVGVRQRLLHAAAAAAATRLPVKKEEAEQAFLHAIRVLKSKR